MHESGGNYMIDADKIKELTQKLKQQGDISLEEADWVYSLCRSNERYVIFNPRSYDFDRKLMAALKEWYKVVAEKIKAGQRGNFVFTVNTVYYFKFMQVAHNAIRKYGTFEDLCNAIVVDKKLYSALPCSKNLFNKTSPLETSGENYYEMENSRAGILYYPVKTEKGTYTILQFMKKLSPIFSTKTIKEDDRELLQTVFEIAAGTLLLSKDRLPYPMNSGWVEKREVKALVLGSFMKHNNISCMIASDILDGRSVVFVEKEKAPLVKEAMKVPFEELAENALQKGIIDEKEKEGLLGEGTVLFPGLKFIDVSTQYIDDIVQAKMKWKAIREEIAEENAWLEEIR